MQRVERELEPRRGTHPVLYIVRARGDRDRAGRKLVRYVSEMGFDRPHVIASARASDLIAGLPATRTDAIPSPATELEARRYAARARAAGADVVIGVGGGLALDFAKAVATGAHVPMIAVPTQLSHDGFASPVSILGDGNGHRVTLEARTPEAVFLSLPTVAHAPQRAYVAGLGDLLSNEFALMDWSLAERRGKDVVLPAASSLSSESLELIEPLLTIDPGEASKDPRRLALLATALVNSGRAMFVAGSSRPASGAEHKISHAIDAVLGPRALHGAQVAFGCLISAHLHEVDVQDLRRRLTDLGLPTHPRHLGLHRAELVRVLEYAVSFRPERYTVLDELGSDLRTLDRLVEELWPDV